MKRLIFSLLCLPIFVLGQAPTSYPISAPPPPAPIGSASVIGNSGPATYTYYVIAHYPIGNTVSLPITIRNAPNTLTGSNFIVVSWTAPSPSITTYDVIRFNDRPNNTTPASSCTHCQVVAGTTSLTLNDTSPTLASSYTLTNLAGPTVGSISIDNTTGSVPILRTTPAVTGGAPAGPAGGQLQGTYPNPTIAPTISSNTTGNAASASNILNPVNAQTGLTYTFTNTDWNKLVTFSNASPIAATLPQAGTAGFEAGKIFDISNIGTGLLTITPTTSTITGCIVGSPTTCQIAANTGISITSDGVNYSVQPGNATFNQTGSGSVARNAVAKDQELLSVMDKGCVGDGIADDSICVQNAFNTATGGRTVHFPAGNYFLNTAPTMPANTQFLCDAASTITIGTPLYMTQGDSVVGPWGGPSPSGSTLNGCTIKYIGPSNPTISISGGTPIQNAVTNVVVSKGTYAGVVYNNGISAVDVLDGGQYTTPPSTVLANVGSGVGATLDTPVIGLYGDAGGSFVYVSGGTATGSGNCAATFTGGNGDAVGYVVVASGVISGTVFVTGRGTGYTTIPTTATLSLPAWGGASTCSGTITYSGGALTVVSIPLTAAGSAYPLAAVILMHDCNNCSVSNIQLDGNNLAGAIGIAYESDNNPPSSLGNINHVTIKGTHHGISVGWDSESNGRDTNLSYCSSDLSQFGCTQSDSLTARDNKVIGTIGDKYGEAFHVNSSNALQLGKIEILEFSLVNTAVHYVASNGTSEIFGVAGGSFVQPAGLICTSQSNPPRWCSTTFRFRHSLSVVPALKHNETEGGSYAIIDDVIPGAGTYSTSEWAGNQLQQMVIEKGNSRIVSKANYGSSTGFFTSGVTGIGTAPSYVSGVGSTCPQSTVQTITFTSPSARVNAQATIAIDITGTPVGATTTLTPGADYIVLPTSGTISGCTGTATFSGGTITAYPSIVNSDMESKWTSIKYLAATGCVSTNNGGLLSQCGTIRAQTLYVDGTGTYTSTGVTGQITSVTTGPTVGQFALGSDGLAIFNRLADGTIQTTKGFNTPNFKVSGSGVILPIVQTSSADGSNLGINLIGTGNLNWILLANRSTVCGAFDAFCLFKGAGTTGAKQTWFDNGNSVIGGITDNGFRLDVIGSMRATAYSTATNCSSSGGTCSSASAGTVSIAAAATTVTVATTAVTANSEIFVTFDESLGTKLSVTCNSAGASEAATYFVSARTAATSFVIKTNVAPTANPACLSYRILN